MNWNIKESSFHSYINDCIDASVDENQIIYAQKKQ